LPSNERFPDKVMGIVTGREKRKGEKRVKESRKARLSGKKLERGDPTVLNGPEPGDADLGMGK
jgi:hypothetical protein